jgi:hypothetical protein
MKNLTFRPLAVVAILAMLGLSAPAVAMADDGPTTTLTPTTTTTLAGTTTTTVASTTRVELLQWTRQYYRWHEARGDIYSTYSKAAAKDLNRLSLALLRGNDAQAKTALAKYNTAVATAKAARDAALTKLGAAPSEPTC